MRYVPEFDGLRALAALLVVLYHSAPTGPFRGAYIGVDIFFVLSGYLITSLLAKEYAATGSINLPRFYWKRALRLVPALMLLLVTYLIVGPIIWPRYNHGTDALLALFYVSDYSKALTGHPHYLGHTWSLSVEEHFYLLWPLLLIPILKCRRPAKALLYAYGLLTLWRYIFAADGQAYFRFDMHATGIVLGCALYFLRPKLRLAPVALGVLVACSILATRQMSWLAVTVAEVAAAVLIASLRQSRLIALFLGSPAMSRLGKISYGVYLWHYPFVLAFEGHSFAITVAATLLFSVAMALLSWFTVEAAGRRLRNSLALEYVNLPSRHIATQIRDADGVNGGCGRDEEHVAAGS